MADFPAIPLWTDAYLADTRHLSTVEHGAYLLLLMEAWRRPSRSLPDDDRLLARLAGLSDTEWLAIRDVILAFWKRDGRSRTWSQKRLSLEATYVANKSKSQRDKAAKRWNRTGKDDATAMPNGCRNDAPTPTPTPTPISDNAKASSQRAPRAAKALKPDGVEAEVWADFQRLRKTKRAPLTDTAIAGIGREARKAGWSMNDALRECCNRGWQGFKAEWVEQNGGRNGTGRTSNGAAPRSNDGFLNAIRESRQRREAGGPYDD